MRKNFLLKTGLGLFIAISFVVQSCAPVATKPVHHKAVRNNQIAAAKLLLQYHANVNARNHKGETPLQAARKAGHPEMTALLKRYDRGLDPLP